MESHRTDEFLMRGWIDMTSNPKSTSSGDYSADRRETLAEALACGFVF